MRKFAMIAALVLCALLVIPAAAGARPHHKKLQGCPKGKHHPRKPGGGRYRRCVPNVKPHHGIDGAAGPTGPDGQSGNNGANGPQGQPPAPPTSETVYDNIASITENPVSLGYEATGTSEFGSQILLNGNMPAVHNPEIQVQMSSWACQTGDWFAGCASAPGSTFLAPLTLKIYAVGSGNSVGPVLFTKAQTFAIPYRPTSDPTCGEVTQYRNVNGVCRNGFPKIVTFGLAGDLPHKFILSVSYNTRDYGASPLGVSSPMDALNVGLEGPAQKGSNPTEAVSGVYWASTTFSDKTGVFHYEEDPSEWSIGESQIAAHIVASH